MPISGDGGPGKATDGAGRDPPTAATINLEVLSLCAAMAPLGGVAFSKAALGLVGLGVGEPRLPVVAPDAEQLAALAAVLGARGLLSA